MHSFFKWKQTRVRVLSWGHLFQARPTLATSQEMSNSSSLQLNNTGLFEVAPEHTEAVVWSQPLKHYHCGSPYSSLCSIPHLHFGLRSSWQNTLEKTDCQNQCEMGFKISCQAGNSEAFHTISCCSMPKHLSAVPSCNICSFKPMILLSFL